MVAYRQIHRYGLYWFSYMASLWLLDVPLALILAIIAGVLNFIPNIALFWELFPPYLLVLLKTLKLYFGLLSYLLSFKLWKVFSLPPGATTSYSFTSGTYYHIPDRSWCCIWNNWACSGNSLGWRINCCDQRVLCKRFFGVRNKGLRKLFARNCSSLSKSFVIPKETSISLSTCLITSSLKIS